LGNMVINVCAKFNYIAYYRLRINKVLGNFRRSETNNSNKSKNKKNNVGNAWGSIWVQRIIFDITL